MQRMVRKTSTLLLFAAGCSGSASRPPPPTPPLASTSGERDPPGDSRAPQSSPQASSSVTETRTRDVIAQIVQQSRPDVRKCYEAELQRSPDLEGVLTLHFTIGPNGELHSSGLNEARSTLRQPTLVACAMTALNRLRFPKSSRGFETSGDYSFNFKP